MTRYEQASAYILAGGASSRMGTAKGLLEIAGEPLIIRTARLVEPLVSTVSVVGHRELYSGFGLQVIEDQPFSRDGKRHDKLGPLAGIVTALRVARAKWCLILACDLPYLTERWLAWLVSHAVVSDREVVVPHTDGRLEPLAAVYRTQCAERMQFALREGTRKVTDAVSRFRVEVLTEDKWRKIEPEARVLKNMNTREDYEEARNWLEGRR